MNSLSAFRSSRYLIKDSPEAYGLHADGDAALPAATSTSAAVGPIALAQLSAATGGADTPLMLLAILQIVPAALFLSMGRYSETASPHGVSKPASDLATPAR